MVFGSHNNCSPQYVIPEAGSGQLVQCVFSLFGGVVLEVILMDLVPQISDYLSMYGVWL